MRRVGRTSTWVFVTLSVLLIAESALCVWQQSVIRRQRLDEVAMKQTYERDIQHEIQRKMEPQLDLLEKLRKSEDEVKVLRRFSFDHPGKQRPEFLEIYGWDARAIPGVTQANCCIAVPVGLPLLQRLRMLAAKLSEIGFDGCPIDVLRVENRNRKRIAIVDLHERANPKDGWPWNTMYFQGSTGGPTTEHILVRTFLQRGCPGKWIDGVEFYYKGKPFSGEWDHIDLSGTFYRDSEGQD